MTVQEVDATELAQAERNIQIAAEKQRTTIQNKIQSRLPNDWY